MQAAEKAAGGNWSSGHSSDKYFFRGSHQVLSISGYISEQNRQKSLPLWSLQSRDRDFQNLCMLPILLTLKAGVFTVTEKTLPDLLPTPTPLPFWSHYVQGILPSNMPGTSLFRASALATSSSWSVPLDTSLQPASSCPSCLDVTRSVGPTLTNLFKENQPLSNNLDPLSLTLFFP